MLGLWERSIWCYYKDQH